MQRRLVTLAALLTALVIVGGAAAQELAPITLPLPQTDGGKPLMQALKLRATSRAFAPDPLPPQTLANLLWAAWGINRPAEGKRTAPSARNWQEIEVVALMESGAFVYDAAANLLRPLARGDLRALGGVQDFVKDAPLTLVLVADGDKIQGDAAEKQALAWTDAAFISQNVYLFCASEGLATGVRLMVDRPALAKALKLRDGQIVALAQSVGFPKKPSAAAGISPEAASWYTATPVVQGVWRIDDHGADNLYLVEGSQKALLIDTGLGAADIMGFVRTLTQRPVLVVNTHGHPDHAGGNHQFAEVHASRAEFELVRQSSGRERRSASAGAMSRTPVPEPLRYRGPEHDTVLVPVSGGFVFDLGGTQLEVISVPGHTPGGVCLLDRGRRLLFTGDNDNTQEWMFLAHSTPLDRYLVTLTALRERSGEFDTLLPGHGPGLDRGFLDEQIQAVNEILDGTCKGEPFKTFAGDGRICRSGRAAIVFGPARLR